MMDIARVGASEKNINGAVERRQLETRTAERSRTIRFLSIFAVGSDAGTTKMRIYESFISITKDIDQSAPRYREYLPCLLTAT